MRNKFIDIGCGYIGRVLPAQNSSASPSKPGLHLHTKWAGKLQHSELATQRALILGSSHSSISIDIWMKDVFKKEGFNTKVKIPLYQFCNII